MNRYINCKDLANVSKDQVEAGTVNIHPNHHVQEWYRWLDNIQDWCISRQLWWGHEIPAYQIVLQAQEQPSKGKLKISPSNALTSWIVFCFVF